jgi:hypothetical protein
MKKNGIDTDYRPSQDQKQSNAIINGRNIEQMTSTWRSQRPRANKKVLPNQRHIEDRNRVSPFFEARQKTLK